MVRFNKFASREPSGGPSRDQRRYSEPAPAQLAPKRLWIYILSVFLLPILVLWHQRNALYAPPYYADPWFYLGFFRDLVEYKRDLFYGVYYGSRLSWILPGFLVHSIFSPVVANCVLHLLVQSTASLSLFFTLYWLAGVRAAFLTCLIFSVNPWLWAATGWDYPDGAGIAYCLLTITLLTRSSRPDFQRWALILAGAGLAAMVYTHVFLATLTPLLGLYYVGLVRTRQGRAWLHSACDLILWGGAGFTGVTILLGVVNYFLDGSFWFYAPSIRQALDLAGNFRFIKSIWVDHQLAPWLWPAAAGCLIAILQLPAHWKDRAASGTVGLLMSAQLLLAVGYMAFLQWRGTTVLGHYPYVSYLLPFVFLVVGVSLWPALRTMRTSIYIVVCCLASLTFAALWYSVPGRLIPVSPSARLVVMMSSSCSLAAALVFRWSRAGAPLALAGFAGLTAVALAQTVNLGGVDVHGSGNQYVRIMQARERIEAVRRGRSVRFWFDRHEPNVHEYTGLNALYLEEFSQIGTDFPRGCERPVDPGTLIVVLSQRQNAAATARAALSDCWRPFGIRPIVERIESVARPNGPYTLAMLGVEPDVVGHPLQKILLQQVQLAYHEASLQLMPEGLLVTTGRGTWGYAGRVKLGSLLISGTDKHLAVRVRVRVLRGRIGVGILDTSGNAYLERFVVRGAPGPAVVILPLAAPSAMGDLIILNAMPGQTISKAIVEEIDVCEMR